MLSNENVINCVICHVEYLILVVYRKVYKCVSLKTKNKIWRVFLKSGLSVILFPVVGNRKLKKRAKMLISWPEQQMLGYRAKGVFFFIICIVS